jgi:hypothetical protein
MLRAVPAPHLDVVYPLLFASCVNLWGQPGERYERIDEQAHRDAMLGGELSRQPPRDTNVAVVVDDDAEYVPLPWNGLSCHEKRSPRIDERALSRVGHARLTGRATARRLRCGSFELNGG